MNERHLINDLFSHLEKRKKEKSEKEKEREIQPPSSLGALGLHKKKVNKESDTGRKGRKKQTFSNHRGGNRATKNPNLAKFCEGKENYKTFFSYLNKGVQSGKEKSNLKVEGGLRISCNAD